MTKTARFLTVRVKIIDFASRIVTIKTGMLYPLVFFGDVQLVKILVYFLLGLFAVRRGRIRRIK